MADKRMFSKKVIDSDQFISMPATSQNLYFHLSMRADDDGFVNSTKTIMSMIGAKDDDLNILVARQFVIPYQSGLIVIRHWRVNNFIRKDRYTPTQYTAEKAQLIVSKDRPYTMRIDNQANGEQMLLTNPKDKVTKAFTKPTIDEIEQYCKQRNNKVNPQYFFDYYESRGWYSGNRKIKDWHATVRLWEQNKSNNKSANQDKGSTLDYDKDFK